MVYVILKFHKWVKFYPFNFNLIKFYPFVKFQYDIYHCCAYSEKFLMMDTEFYSKNKFEKLLRVVGFIIRKYSEAFPTPISNPVH